MGELRFRFSWHLERQTELCCRGHLANSLATTVIIKPARHCGWATRNSQINIAAR